MEICLGLAFQLNNMIEKAIEADYPGIQKVWELSVKATHDFLPDEYFERIRSMFPNFLPVVDLYVYRNPDTTIAGFLGVADHKIEMLFIHPDQRGMGIGRRFIEFALKDLKAYKVDVNEQNKQAVDFYIRMGFEIVGRTDTDGLGEPYPLLEMQIPSASNNHLTQQ